MTQSQSFLSGTKLIETKASMELNGRASQIIAEEDMVAGTRLNTSDEYAADDGTFLIKAATKGP